MSSTRYLQEGFVLAPPGNPGNDPKVAAAPATIAIWASVSEHVDKCIREQIAASVFPIRMKSENWSSGEIVWFLDVIAPSEKMATEVLNSFRQVSKTGRMNVHPVVAKLVAREVLKKLAGGQAVSTSSNQAITRRRLSGSATL